MIMIDTDILIWILRGRQEINDQLKRLAVDASGELFITPIQTAEVFAGARENEKEVTGAFLSALKLFQPGYREGICAGSYLKQYRRSHSVTLADALIAASVVCEGMRLWSMNTRHYPMLDDKHIVVFPE